MEQAQDPTEQITEKPAIPPNATPWSIWMVDMPWPGKDDNVFDCEVPQPAVFQRVVRAELADKSGKRRTFLRLIWIAEARGERQRFTVIMQRPQFVYAVPSDGSGPTVLGTVVTPAGDPIVLWIRPSSEAPLSAVGVE